MISAAVTRFIRMQVQQHENLSASPGLIPPMKSHLESWTRMESTQL